MAYFIPVLLSSSTDGKPIKITAVATPGTPLHTCTSTSGEFDEVFIQVFNTDTVERTVTLEIGGTTDPDNLFPKTYAVGIKQFANIVTGIPRANNGTTFKMFASAANVIIAVGNVNRYKPTV